MANVTEKKLEVGSSPSLPDKNHDPVNNCDLLSDLFASTIKGLDKTNRIAQYKCRIKEETGQESRRRLLLEEQKEKRNAKFNERRNLESKKENDDSGSNWSKEEMFIDNDADDEMEWSTIKKIAWHKQGRTYRDVLMYSEWFVDIPNDLADKWILVPCPAGKRSIVVTKQMRTISYTKKGIPVSYFKSSLPPKTILDCIWSIQTKSFYVIDVIQWNGMSFRNCQTDFRFYWLDSKFEENPQYSIENEKNNYPLINLQRCNCSLNQMSTMINNFPIFTNNCPKLDGLLFYHRETHYTSCYTPLVGWLKAFMLPDALGISVRNEYNEEKPEGYENYKKYIQEKDEKRVVYWANKRIIGKNKMECE